MALKLELKDNSLYIDGKIATENDFTVAIKEGLHHHISFVNSKEMIFFVDRVAEDWVVKLPAVAPVGFKYFYFHIKEMLEKNGCVATLLQDTYWLDRQ